MIFLACGVKVAYKRRSPEERNSTLDKDTKKSVAISDDELIAYDAGVDAAKYGPNITNCSFRFFATKEQTAAWEEGFHGGY